MLIMVILVEIGTEVEITFIKVDLKLGPSEWESWVYWGGSWTKEPKQNRTGCIFAKTFDWDDEALRGGGDFKLDPSGRKSWVYWSCERCSSTSFAALIKTASETNWFKGGDLQFSREIWRVVKTTLNLILCFDGWWKYLASNILSQCTKISSPLNDCSHLQPPY